MSATNNARDLLTAAAEVYGLDIDDHARDLFSRYTGLVREGNEKTNLVSRRDIDRFVTHHLLDSLKIASCIDIPETGRVIDFGSGAGLPGIPLAIIRPGLEVILVDSRKKRCIFLEDAVRRLGLAGVSVVCGRIETLDTSHDNTFDMVATRGTVSLAAFYRVASRLVAPGGALVAIKGDHIGDERNGLDAVADTTLFNILYTHPQGVPGVRDGHVVIMTKR